MQVSPGNGGHSHGSFQGTMLRFHVGDPNVVRFFVVAGSSPLLLAKNNQIQLLFGWSWVLTAFPLSSKGQAFFGTSYDEKKE